MATPNLNSAAMFASFMPFNLGEDGASATASVQRWSKWLGRFRNMLEAMPISEDKKKKAMLLHYGG